jgi:hypothetical protein
MNIVERLRILMRRKLADPEDEAARREAQRIREDVETLKTGAMMVAPPSLYGDSKESQGR